MTFYTRLYPQWKSERNSPGLVKLERNFFDQAREYLNHLRTQADNEDDPLLAKLFEQRYARASYLINDLINLRMGKHIQQTLDKVSHEKEMSHQEENFRSGLERLTSEFWESIFTTEDMEYEDEDEMILIRMLADDQEEGMGPDLRTYGPFRTGDIVYLPTENANIFEKKRKGRRLKTN